MTLEFRETLSSNLQLLLIVYVMLSHVKEAMAWLSYLVAKQAVGIEDI